MKDTQTKTKIRYSPISRLTILDAYVLSELNLLFPYHIFFNPPIKSCHNKYPSNQCIPIYKDNISDGAHIA